MSVSVGDTFGPYRIQRELGRGGMGQVLLALEEGLEREVALKLLPPELAQRDPTFVTRFVREARSAAAVRHPNVVGVLDAGQVEATHYIAFEFVDGASLEAIVKEGGPLLERRIVELSYGLARGLAAVHERGLIHRDVKPDNVLVRAADGCPLLADLGLAKREDDGETALTMAGAVLGTPRYMSPEQALSEEVDGRTDLYSLGLCVHFMASAQVPFVAKGDSALKILSKRIHGEPVDLREVAPVSADLAYLTRGLCARQAPDRYASALHVVEELERLRAGGPVLGPVAAARAHERLAGEDPAARAATALELGPQRPAAAEIDTGAPTLIEGPPAGADALAATALEGAPTAAEAPPPAPPPGRETQETQERAAEDEPSAPPHPPADPLARAKGQLLLTLCAALLVGVPLAAWVLLRGQPARPLASSSPSAPGPNLGSQPTPPPPVPAPSEPPPSGASASPQPPAGEPTPAPTHASSTTPGEAAPSRPPSEPTREPGSDPPSSSAADPAGPASEPTPAASDPTPAASEPTPAASEPDPAASQPSPAATGAPAGDPAPSRVELETVGEALRYVAQVRRDLYRDHGAARRAVERLEGPSLQLWRSLRTLRMALQRTPRAFEPERAEQERRRALRLIRKAPAIAAHERGELPSAVQALLEEWSQFAQGVDRLREGLRSESFQTLSRLPRLPEGHPGRRQLELLAELAHAIDDSQRWWNLRERELARLRPLLSEARSLPQSALAALLPHEVELVRATLSGLVADPRTSLFTALFPQRDRIQQSVFAQARLRATDERESQPGQGVLLRGGPMRSGLEVQVDGSRWELALRPHGVGIKAFRGPFRWQRVRWSEEPLAVGIELRPNAVLLTLPRCEPAQLELEARNSASTTLSVSTRGRHGLRGLVLLDLPRPARPAPVRPPRRTNPLDDLFGRRR